MNKIYSDPISKAYALADGVKKQSGMLAQKGIAIDVDKLFAACAALEKAGELQDVAEVKLKEARETAHIALEKLKEVFVASKAPIKQNFPPEMWLSFGLHDKK